MATKKDPNYGFTNGDIPPGVTVEDNVKRAKEYQRTHTTEETARWFWDTVRGNADKHLPANLSMDYNKFMMVGITKILVISIMVSWPRRLGWLTMQFWPGLVMPKDEAMVYQKCWQNYLQYFI